MEQFLFATFSAIIAIYLQILANLHLIFATLHGIIAISPHIIATFEFISHFSDDNRHLQQDISHFAALLLGTRGSEI